MDGTTYRLNGIDAPEMDQVCLDEKGAVWKCGIAAREALETFIGNGPIHCKDLGPDRVYPEERRIGSCSINGVVLNEWLVKEGWALNFEPYAKRRFETHQAGAERDQRGLWKGCFVAPSDLRTWNKSKANFLGAACGASTPTRDTLFPNHAQMPPGCPIKGKVSQHAGNGHDGIYHMEGCRNYRTTFHVNRWFCSEDDAKDARFRKAKNCSSSKNGGTKKMRPRPG